MFLPTNVSDESKAVMDSLSAEDRQKLVHDCVSAIIILGQNQAPIKKADLNKHLQKTPRIHHAILNVASYELDKNFGFRLYELDDKRLLLASSSVEFSKYAKFSSTACEELTVLYLILVDIFASADEKCSEDEIENSLTPLDIKKETLKSHIDNLVRKYYIQIDKETVNQEKKLYVWGPRAMAEIDPDKFMERFINLVGEGTEKDWPEQVKRIEKLKNIAGR